MTSSQDQIWLKAQQAEKGHWQELWSKDKNIRQSLFDHEAKKADFIFEQMVEHFGVNPVKNWKKLTVLDVGCGPASIIARSKLGKTRIGVDPLKYPTWVYKNYGKNRFKVILQLFEKLPNSKKYDVIIFYNALQHFADLDEVANKTKKILAKNGYVYLSEYLEIPPNEAHIQYLHKDLLDSLFEDAGFKIESVKQPVRLAGLVEKSDGQPIDLYIARLS